jgi:hypothetical protein
MEFETTSVEVEKSTMELETTVVVTLPPKDKEEDVMIKETTSAKSSTAGPTEPLNSKTPSGGGGKKKQVKNSTESVSNRNRPIELSQASMEKLAQVVSIAIVNASGSAAQSSTLNKPTEGQPKANGTQSLTKSKKRRMKLQKKLKSRAESSDSQTQVGIAKPNLNH